MRTEMNCRPRARTKPAFTITEVAAVLVCVGVFAGLVQTSLQEAIGKSRHTACLSRLEKIGQATHVYSEYDPTQTALPVHGLQNRQRTTSPTFIGAYEWGGKSGVGRPNFVAEYSGSLWGSKYGTAAGFGPAKRPLNKIIYPSGFPDVGSIPDRDFSSSDREAARTDTKLELEAFRCPGDDGPPLGAHSRDWVQNPRRTSFDHFGTSYTANMFLVTAGSSLMHSNGPYLRPMSDVPNPARTIAYEDNIGRWAWACRREQNGCEQVGLGVDPGPTKSLRGWHGKDWTYNRSFVDGHAGRQIVYIESTEDVSGYANHYRSERLPCYPQLASSCNQEPGPCEKGESAFHVTRCIIVRGDGWQKDTMPAQPVCTGLYNPCSGRPSYECEVEPANP